MAMTSNGNPDLPMLLGESCNPNVGDCHGLSGCMARTFNLVTAVQNENTKGCKVKLYHPVTIVLSNGLAIDRN
jgi:hypothetical protein